MKKPLKLNCALHGQTQWPFSKIMGGWVCCGCVRDGIFNYQVIRGLKDLEGIPYGRGRENKQTG